MHEREGGAYPFGLDRLLPSKSSTQQAERLPSASGAFQQSILPLQRTA